MYGGLGMLNRHAPLALSWYKVGLQEGALNSRKRSDLGLISKGYDWFYPGVDGSLPPLDHQQRDLCDTLPTLSASLNVLVAPPLVIPRCHANPSLPLVGSST